MKSNVVLGPPNLPSISKGSRTGANLSFLAKICTKSSSHVSKRDLSKGSKSTVPPLLLVSGLGVFKNHLIWNEISTGLVGVHRHCIIQVLRKISVEQRSVGNHLIFCQGSIKGIGVTAGNDSDLSTSTISS